MLLRGGLYGGGGGGAEGEAVISNLVSILVDVHLQIGAREVWREASLEAACEKSKKMGSIWVYIILMEYTSMYEQRKKKVIPTLSFAACKRQRSLCRRHRRRRCYPFLWVVRQDGAARRVNRLDMRGGHGQGGDGRHKLVAVAR